MSDYNEIKAKLSAIISQYYGMPIYIKSTLVNDEGHLIVTLSNDDVYDAGSVIGPQGEQGEQGIQGIQGKSAYQVAVDNGFEGTEQDWLKHISDGQPAFAATTADMTDQSKLYVMPDKKVYGYFSKSVPVKVNSFDPNAENNHLNARFAYTATHGAVLNEGVYNNQTNPTGVQFTAYTNVGAFISDYIDVDFPTLGGNYNAKVSGYSAADPSTVWKVNSPVIAYFDENYKYIAAVLVFQGGAYNYTSLSFNEDGSTNIDFDAVKAYVFTDVDGQKVSHKALLAKTKYLRFAFTPKGTATTITAEDLSNIKIEFEAKTTEQPVFGWYDTGMTWTPTDYSNDILAIENELEDHELRIKDLENSQGGSSELTIPSYWETAVAAAETKIKTLQDNGGADVIQFVWASDTHNYKGQSANGRWSTPKNVGRIAKRLMDDLNIPYAVMTGDLVGDIGTADTAPDDSGLVDFFDKIVNPIGKDNVLIMTGNHDGATYFSDGTTISLSEAEKYNWYFRPFAKSDFEWGDYPSYYYKDLPQSKIRLIVLSPNDYSYTIDENRHPTPNPFRVAKYEAGQLKWLAETALDVPSGYSVVVFTHQPPVAFNLSSSPTGFYTVLPTNNDVLVNIVTAFTNKTAYSATVDGTQIAKDYTGISATMTAMFCGHIHKDDDDTSLAFPVITIQCAGNYSMDSAITFTNSSDNETAFDVVTINKSESKIYLTRLGVGSDRVIEY